MDDFLQKAKKKSMDEVDKVKDLVTSIPPKILMFSQHNVPKRKNMQRYFSVPFSQGEGGQSNGTFRE